jgi:integrase
VPKTSHALLVERFQADLRRRADAGEIDPRTVARYESALKHYLGFAELPSIRRSFPHVSSADRQFALELMAHLRTLLVPSNGHPNTPARPMRRPDYVLDVVRALYDWAADPQRGKLIPEGFHNPFVRRDRRNSTTVAASIDEPDITLDMAVEFLEACDVYQLRLFTPVAIYGLRASEPCLLFREHLSREWLDVPCLPELAYFTKGRRNKRLPLVPCLDDLLQTADAPRRCGLLYLRRGVADNDSAPLMDASLQTLIAEYQRRCAAAAIRTAADRQRVRDQILHDAGGIDYDVIVTEFRKVAHALNWPQRSTLKDFRHLFATALGNAGMPEHYRKFLLGQSPGRAAIVTYTHLNEIRHHFEEAINKRLRPLVAAIERRSHDLGITP